MEDNTGWEGIAEREREKSKSLDNSINPLEGNKRPFGRSAIGTVTRQELSALSDGRIHTVLSFRSL